MKLMRGKKKKFTLGVVSTVIIALIITWIIQLGFFGDKQEIADNLMTEKEVAKIEGEELEHMSAWYGNFVIHSFSEPSGTTFNLSFSCPSSVTNGETSLQKMDVKSSNTDIVEVTNVSCGNGIGRVTLKANHAGEVTLKLMHYDGNEYNAWRVVDTADITVTANCGIEFAKETISIKEGELVQVTFDYYGGEIVSKWCDGVIANLTWAYTNTNQGTAYITGLKKGTTEVSITISDGRDSVSDKIRVNVSEAGGSDNDDNTTPDNGNGNGGNGGRRPEVQQLLSLQ